MNKRAAIYARVSRAYKEDDERLSIETQLIDCEEYCRKRGYIVVETFVDKERYKAKGKLVSPSGTRKDRPGYAAMLKLAKAGEIDVIVAWKEDRLYRGMYAALPLSEALDETRSLSVELVAESFDHKMLGIKAAIAKLELDNIRDRMVRARQARVERGDIPGSPTRFGYRKVGKRWEVNEYEAGIIRQVFDWYIAGENNLQIRARLNNLGVPVRVGKVWSKSSVVNILRFAGYATGQFETTLWGETYSIPVPTIISMETWDLAEANRVANKHYRGRNVREDYLLRGMVYCPCGWRMGAKTGSGGVRNKDRKYPFYRCALRQHQPENQHHRCPNAISAITADRVVWDHVKKVVRNPEIIQRAIDKKIVMLREEQQAIFEDAEKLQRQLDDIQQERQWVITQARKGRISDEDMDYQLSALHIQVLDLRKKQSDHQSSVAAMSQVERLKVWAEQYLSDVEKGLDVLDQDPERLPADQWAELYEGLIASRFEEKYNGNHLAALRWAILEEKRKIVRFLVQRVDVFVDDTGQKQVKALLFLDLPDQSTGSLVHHDQSLSYRPEGLDEFLESKANLGAEADAKVRGND